MSNNTNENILDNIENLLDKVPENKLHFASEEKLPTTEEISKNDALIKENPKACQELIRDLLKHSLMTNTAKNEHLLNLKKLILEILQENDEKNYNLYFDEIFFDRLEALCEKKEVFQYIEMVELVVSLVNNEKLLLSVIQLKENRMIFTMILNYLMGINEVLNLNLLGISVNSALRSLLEFLKKNSIFLIFPFYLISLRIIYNIS